MDSDRIDEHELQQWIEGARIEGATHVRISRAARFGRKAGEVLVTVAVEETSAAELVDRCERDAATRRRASPLYFLVALAGVGTPKPRAVASTCLRLDDDERERPERANYESEIVATMAALKDYADRMAGHVDRLVVQLLDQSKTANAHAQAHITTLADTVKAQDQTRGQLISDMLEMASLRRESEREEHRTKERQAFVATATAHAVPVFAALVGKWAGLASGTQMEAFLRSLDDAQIAHIAQALSGKLRPEQEAQFLQALEALDQKKKPAQPAPAAAQNGAAS